LPNSISARRFTSTIGACLLQATPAMLRGVHGDRERYESAYFAPYPGYYCAGDSARSDADGYYWIQGRIDDVLNVSGHRIGTSEVEAALSAHDGVAEAAVVGVPHAVKEQGVCAFVTLKEGARPSAALRRELVACALLSLFVDVLLV
jgi:acetyl-CoA synthetase